MSDSLSRKRPWLAALLAVLATGLGHLYLRRWRRALGWIVALVGASVLFVDPGTVDALLAGNPVDPLAIAPIAVVGGFSVVDAYLLASAQNALAQRRVAVEDGQLTHCPSCGKELDDDLEFCHWCSTDLGAFGDSADEIDGDDA
ncbi:hypothetical protein BV210_05155 [Halorientalis sp. IM1011]|uniref:zinc ribbon domain-containing protein n=1 Tax=Halorientalis sp. IM1011 TaxID=1932360 RepID=UPI00097CD531|nr:zinc ribbon domain-containing protein [Halorientalis sp. IM1011]AQL42136.1 hypothetical protein BV210_05155 [Halorientalis sp. IM1011]